MKWDLLPPAGPQYLDILEAPPSSPNERDILVRVVRLFEFFHARTSQSLAVLDEQVQHDHVYLKGSFERVHCLSVSVSLASLVIPYWWIQTP
ncbi:hypothetical protein K501DRAFT_287277 [Backusella circina FSU 941]|nr:hypothetical protein K501DRAFT_287277 [Backusella circina FSU 941]